MLDLYTWCRNNWDTLPADVRQQCLNHLDDKLLKNHAHFMSNLEYLHHYRENPNFHLLGGGMLIRNLLRQMLLDSALPAISLMPDGNIYDPPSSNWDDYYTGAVDELLERYP
jgi:hypothetical protein